MTSKKSFKSRVRARMDKTGERYTTARHHLVDKAERGQPTAAPAAGETMLERIADEAMRERTGRGWDEWFALLDGWDATERGHTEIARWLVAEHGVDGWWAQSVTVGYEQARGLRTVGQRSDGDFYASATRTVAVPAERLYEAFTDAALRARWLPGVRIDARAATAPKRFRADWAGGPTRITVGFTPRGDAKALVEVTHERLADAEAVVELKAYWRERLAALKRLLES